MYKIIFTKSKHSAHPTHLKIWNTNYPTETETPWAPRDERTHIRACINSAYTAHAHVHHGMWRHMDEHGLRI